MTKFRRDGNRAGAACGRPLALVLLLPLLPPSTARADDLAQGRAALRRRWYVTAFRRCGDAAAEAREEPRRTAALLCQGRAALGLKWPMQAARIAGTLLRARDLTAGHLLLGDAYAALGDCRRARPEYLIVLERWPRSAAALAGLKGCAGDPPPPPPPPPPAGEPTADRLPPRGRSGYHQA